MGWTSKAFPVKDALAGGFSIRPHQSWGLHRCLRITYTVSNHSVSVCRGTQLSRPMCAVPRHVRKGALFERVCGRLGEERQRRQWIEYRFEEWAPTVGHRLSGAELAVLTLAQRGTLDAIAAYPMGLTMREWHDAR